jgi:SAM-dependent methyltransferase
MKIKMEMKKLNVGCGKDIRADFVNLDVAALPGVDVVHDLSKMPWPFEDSHFEHIELINVLEHLPDTIATLEELHRIAKNGCKLIVRVPFWNSPAMPADPTHKRNFSERTLNFFDPAFPECRDRPYYSSARFRIVRKSCYVFFFYFLRINNPLLTGILFHFARFFGAIVWVVEFDLVALKEETS